MARSALLLIWCLQSAFADWGDTINRAGLQRTLSQTMTKEFLLVARGDEVPKNKAKLVQGIESFNFTLNALLGGGDVGQGILGSPTEKVTLLLQEVVVLWKPFAELLITNMDSVRRGDGSVDTAVLGSLSTRNGPLLDASNAVVSALVDAAKVSGAETNGLVQDIAGRQRTFIQSMCKDALFVALGISPTFHMESLIQTNHYFEDSHKGIIEGVPFVGLPALKELCTMHQMSLVTYYYHQLRPLLSGILTQETAYSAQRVAKDAINDIVTLTDPLFEAMVEAVRLYGHPGTCNPMANMTHTDWHNFFLSLEKQRLWTQEASQHFAQLALKVDVKTLQVEITVFLAEASENLRNLVEGSRTEGVVPPPSAQVLDALLGAWGVWGDLETELSAAVHHLALSDVVVGRVVQLSNKVMEFLVSAIEESIRLAANSTFPTYSFDLAGQQPTLSARAIQSACLVMLGYDTQENWNQLNTSRQLWRDHHWTLLQGAPATATTPAVNGVTDVCIVQKMKHAADVYHHLEQRALAVALHGQVVDLQELNAWGHEATEQVEAANLQVFAENVSCNTTVLPEEWQLIHAEVSALAHLSQKVSTEYILVRQGKSPNNEMLTSLLVELEETLKRVTFGSSSPPRPAPPTQDYLNHLLLRLTPAVDSLKLSAEGSAASLVLTAADRVLEAASTIQAQYLEEALAADPSWPGRRLDVALNQLTGAQQVFKEALLFVFDLNSDKTNFLSAVESFESALLRLKDGGGGLEPIMLPERSDLKAQWDRIHADWTALKAYQDTMSSEDASRMEAALLRLVAQIRAALPMYAQRDVKAPQSFPWPRIIYSIIGACLTCCCCTMVLYPWLKSYRKRTKLEAQAAVPQADDV